MNTASKQARLAGIKGLKELSEYSGVPVRTLQHWHVDKPALFRTIIIGVLAIKQHNSMSEVIDG